MEEVRNLCSWSCNSGALIYSLRIPYGAYSCGQTVKYFLAIKNQTMADTTGYTLEFFQKMKFTARSPSRNQRQQTKKLLEKSSSEKCLRLTNRIFEGQFRIPSVPPTTDPSSIICVEYKVKISIDMSGCHNTKVLSMPIFIGNIPLRESLGIEEIPSASHTPTAPESDASKEDSKSDMPPSYQDLSKYMVN